MKIGASRSTRVHVLKPFDPPYLNVQLTALYPSARVSADGKQAPVGTLSGMLSLSADGVPHIFGALGKVSE